MSLLESIRIKIHSFTDLITNSSTIIYTHSEDSVESCKKMVNEFLSVLGSDKRCDDLFEITCDEGGEEESTYLEIRPLDKEYKKLAERIRDFLYSTDHTEGYG